MLAPDTVVTVRGRLNRRDGQVALYAQEMTIPDVSGAAHEAVTITLPTNRCTGPLVERFKSVLEKHPGMSTVRLTLTSPGREVHTGLRPTSARKFSKLCIQRSHTVIPRPP